MEKYRGDILFFLLLLGVLVASYCLAEAVLPFFIGLAFAAMINPVVRKIQKWIPNRHIAVSLFMGFVLLFTFGSTYLFGYLIVKDVNRLTKAFYTYATNHQSDLDEATKVVKEYVAKIYDPAQIQQRFNIHPDSLNYETAMRKIKTDSLAQKIDMQLIEEAWSSVTSFAGTAESPEKAAPRSEINWFWVIMGSFVYFVYIIYDFPYFESRWKFYIGERRLGRMSSVLDDFKHSFIPYFRQRGKIVLFYTVLFTAAFSIIGLPGALVLGILSGLFCFVPYLQYLTLLPLALGSLVLTMENGHPFYLYFGIILALFVAASIFEELVLYPRLIERSLAMNPVVMMLAISVWGAVLGLFGVLIALPLTALLVLYVKRILLLDRFENH